MQNFVFWFVSLWLWVTIDKPCFSHAQSQIHMYLGLNELLMLWSWENCQNSGFFEILLILLDLDHCLKNQTLKQSTCCAHLSICLFYENWEQFLNKNLWSVILQNTSFEICKGSEWIKYKAWLKFVMYCTPLWCY